MTMIHRLKRKEGLDYGTNIGETTGDTLFEGRHGNSIRIGSRSNKPYIFLSNERMSDNDEESLGDGSIISITSDGTLYEHFETYLEDNGKESIEVNGFTLASDTLKEPNRFMGTLVSQVNNNQDVQQLIYDYSGNQTLITSDRITLNSKLDDIFVSSIKDIYIGSGRHLSLTSPKSINILSNNVNIGNNTKENLQSMVLGDTLKEVLNDIINLIPTIKIPTMLGPQVPMPDIQTKITQITTKIDNITSTKHKIEQG